MRNITLEATLGERIRKLRKEQKLSQEELALLLGYKSFTTIQKWEEDTTTPRWSKVEKIAEILNTTIDYLVNGAAHTELTSTQRIVNTPVPIQGYISCGGMKTAVSENIGTFEINERLKTKYGKDNLVFVIADGESMNMKIPNGDLVLIAKNQPIQNGDIVAVRYDDEVTLKVFYKTNFKVILEPLSFIKDFQPVEIDLSECIDQDCSNKFVIEGKYVWHCANI